jgi:hypothetical protein
MRKLAIAQLGTNDPSFDKAKFIELLIEQTIRQIVPHALRVAAKTAKDERKAFLEEAAFRCERDGDLEAAKNAREAASAAASYAAIYASASAYAYASAYAANAAAADATAYASASACASAATYADATACATDDDIALKMSADIGVQALRAAGAHGIKLMDQLIPSA